MSHQIDESVFRGVLSEDIEWKPFPAFPPSVRLAVVVGDPSEPGAYVIRVKLPSGVKLMPHIHPEDRVYTVISGVFYILGKHFDSEKLESYPPGSVTVLPGGTAHFHWARSGEYVTQVTAIGPLGLEYVNPHCNRVPIPLLAAASAPMTRCAPAIATRSAMPSSRSRNPGSPATASGSA